LPVHSSRSLVENLKTIASAVALARVGIAREDHRKSNVAAAVFGPALEDRKVVERKVIAANHFLARPTRHNLRKKRTHLGELRKHLEFADDSFRHAHLEELGNAPSDFVNRR